MSQKDFKSFTDEVKIRRDVAEAFTALGEACKRTAGALGEFFQAVIQCAVAITNGAGFPVLLKAAQAQKAIAEAPPRVRHLALHGKKYRTRKKNINRAMREYQRRTQK